ncbi:MAG: hypothetical protein ACRDP9_15565 [Kribbellaceae bacterium]|nr:hypothetical protein [Kribbellaceae bacterium]
MADTRYRVTAASITLHPRRVLTPEATPSRRKWLRKIPGRPAWTVTPEANWLVMEVHLTQGMLLPVDVNPPDVAQLLESGLIEAVKPNAKSRAT